MNQPVVEGIVSLPSPNIEDLLETQPGLGGNLFPECTIVGGPCVAGKEYDCKRYGRKQALFHAVTLLA